MQQKQSWIYFKYRKIRKAKLRNLICHGLNESAQTFFLFYETVQIIFPLFMDVTSFVAHFKN